ncbi:MAG: non-hydrolyzing UDP-N-acetylglucosamine 2-epimerase [Candidatus Velthaea sp.]
MNVLSVVGARPQFVKAAVLSAEFARRGIAELLVHTGQHYDYDMSQVFFDELGMRPPDRSLEVGSGTHAEQTAEMLRRLEPIVLEARPDWVVIYGDTNSTLAGALVASKLSIPLAHVEAGLRSFDRTMPEEINRVVADHLSALLLAPTPEAVRQLAREGIFDGVALVGDLMIDLARETAAALPASFPLPEGLRAGEYGVATVHRAATTDDPAALRRIIEGLRDLPFPVLFPVHPRTAQHLPADLRDHPGAIRFTSPISYRTMIAVLRSARVVLTDSGGIQKEAAALHVPCVTLRENTEWVETVESGWNALAGTDPSRIAEFALRPAPRVPGPYDQVASTCAAAIVDALMSHVRLAEPALP